MTTTQTRLGRPFALLWTAGTVSALGDGVRVVAFPLIAASLTDDPRQISLVFAAGYLAWPLFGLVGGAVVDRVERRRLMIRADLLRVVLLAAFALLLLGSPAPLVALAVVNFGLGVAETFFDNAASSILPMMVDAGALERANARLTASVTLSESLIGAFLGALLFELGRIVPVLADAVSFLGSGLLLLASGGRFQAHTGKPLTTVRQDIAEGMRWLWRHRLLRTCALLLLGLNATLGGSIAVLVLYTHDLLHLNGFGYSAMMGAFAVGGLAGSFAAPVVRSRFGLPATLMGCVATFTVALGLPGAVVATPVAAVAFVVIGANGGAWNVITLSLRQAIVPARLLGRVMSSYRLLGLGARPLGAAAAGLIAHAFGLRAVFLTACAAMAVGGLAAIPALRTAAIEPPGDSPAENGKAGGPETAVGSGIGVPPGPEEFSSTGADGAKSAENERSADA